MITPFGKVLRNLRMDRGTLLKEMAEQLGVTPSYLSSVESGKRNISEDWPQRIGALYGLTASEIEDLEVAAAASTTQIKLDLSQTDRESRELAVAFARSFNELTPEDQKEMLALLKKRRS